MTDVFCQCSALLQSFLQSHSSQYDLTLACLLALLPFLCNTPGELECDEEVFEMQVCEMPAPQDRPVSTFGTYGDDLNLMKDAWEHLHHTFSVFHTVISNSIPSSQGQDIFQGLRPQLNLLNKFPVDMLVVECGSWQCPKHFYTSFQ